MSALKHLLDRYNEGDAMTNLETLIITARDETAAEELATLRQVQAEREYYKNNASAWKDYADHQEYCAECAVDVDNCEAGSLLKSVARVKITDAVIATGDA